MLNKLTIRTVLVGAVLATAAACTPTSASPGQGQAGPLRLETTPPAFTHAAEGARPPNSQYDGQNYTYTVRQYVDFVIGDLDRVWSAWMQNAGFEEPWVRIHLVTADQPFTTKCWGGRQVPHDEPNAYFCPHDVDTKPNGESYTGSIILPATTMLKMWNGNIFGSQSKQAGDFAAAILMAHEFGHHIVDEIQKQLGARGQVFAKPAGKNNELISDCLAGVWAATAYHSGLLEQGDWDEAAAALEVIGDGPGVSKDPHGTPAERVQALTDGYTTADGWSCIKKYWV